LLRLPDGGNEQLRIRSFARRRIADRCCAMTPAPPVHRLKFCHLYTGTYP
jgi:hypothetical protein